MFKAATSPVGRGLAVVLSGVLLAGAARAQAAKPEQPANVVIISASGQLDVPQDWLTMTLTVSRDGGDAALVQTQLRQAVDAALAMVKPQVAAKQLEVRTGSFGVYPRHGSNGKIAGWQGTAELILEGRDFLRISSTAGKATSMGIGNVAFSLSRETQQKLESDAQSMAIERFKAKATEVAKGFGFAGYTLREVSVSSAGQGDRPVYARFQQAPMAASVASDAPLPVEAGKSQVTVTVSGSVQLR
ncbi:SIMPL domain-containing protein [Hydrogenophaga sp. MI9]|uniref:SIMPL domain-containing protein n=1 Tax=Hydrogenophaga sp. MI9 TaxID=3453719 RepID=UPI003EEBB6C1